MPKYVVKTVAGLGAASVIAVSGAAMANSQTTPPAHSAPSTAHAQHRMPPGGHLRGMHHGKPVTGATLAKVKAAVATKDSSIMVQRVFQGPKGEFHAMGTKAGKRVRVDVSKDMKTVTVMAADRHDGHGPRGPQHPGHAPAGHHPGHGPTGPKPGAAA